MILAAAREIPRRFCARLTRRQNWLASTLRKQCWRRRGKTCRRFSSWKLTSRHGRGIPNADLLYANASFQWVPDHVSVLLRLLKGLKAGGVLALQMPDNLDEPSHRLMRETAETGPWAKALRHAAGSREVIRTPNEYYTLLKPHCRSLDIWHTAYYHVLDGVQGIVDFVSTTGLRPYLDPLDEAMRGQFVDAYRAGLAKAYPVILDGKVLMRFPRLFLVAQV